MRTVCQLCHGSGEDLTGLYANGTPEPVCLRCGGYGDLPEGSANPAEYHPELDGRRNLMHYYAEDYNLFDPVKVACGLEFTPGDGKYFSAELPSVMCRKCLHALGIVVGKKEILEALGKDTILASLNSEWQFNSINEKEVRASCHDGCCSEIVSMDSFFNIFMHYENYRLRKTK